MCLINRGYFNFTYCTDTTPTDRQLQLQLHLDSYNNVRLAWKQTYIHIYMYVHTYVHLFALCDSSLSLYIYIHTCINIRHKFDKKKVLNTLIKFVVNFVLCCLLNICVCMYSFNLYTRIHMYVSKVYVHNICMYICMWIHA